MSRITTVEQLRAIFGHPKPAVARKLQNRLTPQAIRFLEKSPLAFLSTTDARGQSMVSPKGDVPGFITAEDEHTLLLPERSGNNLVFTLQNILHQPRVALIALVPGTGETLRIEGTAELLDDTDLRARFTVRDRPALLVMRITVEMAYFHCAKSLLRSGVWNPTSWPEALRISFGEEIAINGGLATTEITTFDAGVQDRYRTDL
ncbi:MAG: pyridoxamine 5'-phosphate oxidase family protein [Burkholderiales bacterium]|nr:pyridoxamine 5'-phosphate oxidase family protein [Burkholderiales bacterium]